ncbi:MAG: amidohydrolase [Myxococcota bacterium]|jgi:hypothetical protein
MKMTINSGPVRIALTSLLALGPGAAALAQAAPELVAGEIYINGVILTPQGPREAIATRDGIIVAVGSSDEVMKAAGTRSQITDLGGKTVMPGLYDMHVHVFYAGRAMLSCRFAQGAKATEIAAAVKACAAKARPGEWILGGSWVGAAFEPEEQHKRLLDKAAPNNPVLLDDESLHSIWVNSRALELAGVTRDTRDPQGGVIDRDRNGEPTGVLRELATRLVEEFVPPVSVQGQEAAIKAATDEMLSLGIVGLTDASIRRESIDGWRNYAGSGKLKQYSRGCIVWGPNSGNSEDLIPIRNHYAAGRLQLDCVKIFLDGVPIEGRTAAMLEPYVAGSGKVRGHPPVDEKGMLLVAADRLNTAVADFDRQGINVKFHAAGDAAVRQAADAIGHARKANGATGPRHEIGHNTFVDQADVAKGRTTPFTWELSPYIWWPTPITSVDIAAAVGPERMKRLWPIKDVLESGANVVIGSDWPVVPSANPWLALETLVSRQVPGAIGDPINAGQRITRQQAMDIMTRNGAAQMGRLDRGGTIEVGKFADFIVIDQNPLTVPLGDIHKTKVIKTFIAGELVFNSTGK